MAFETPFDIKTVGRDALAEIAVLGELDCATAPRLSHALAGLAEPGGVILVDLTDTEFMDCAGIAPLIEACLRQRELGGDLILDVADGAVSKFITWAGLDQVIRVASGPKAVLRRQPRDAARAPRRAS